MRQNTDQSIHHIQQLFSIPAKEQKKIIKEFHSEMSGGLSGRKSSLKMIPAYVARPSGSETGKFIALDLGGTNFRILLVELKGNGRITVLKSRQFTIDKKHITNTEIEFFDFIAGCVKSFIGEKLAGEKLSLGFTFSFPVKQTSVNSGVLIRWTKGFSASGVIGRDVVGLLGAAFERAGLKSINISALVNDTVGTLIAKSYEDASCDVGVIIGTGTNACYAERIGNIKKWQGPRPAFSEEMVVNIEWGNFNKLKKNRYDIIVDKGSDNKGEQILEKMVSGMYMGELVRLVLAGLEKYPSLDKKGVFKTEYVSAIEADSSRGFSKIKNILKGIGIKNSSFEDRVFIKKVCSAVSGRAAVISAAAIAAVVTKMDPSLSGRHVIAIDGSVYEKHPYFAQRLNGALKALYGKRSSRIRPLLAKDGSGAGAAIIAAVAASS